MSVRRIGVLTSGGDAPGMNPCVRAVVRTALYHGLECYGIRRGWNGLISGDIVRLDEKSVAHTINRGGTILYTARSEEFMTEAGQRKAVSTCKFLGLDSIIAIGGDGNGFIQTSTDVLQSRKLFVWGMGAGGRNWQTFLAQKGCQYLEIQAGLAHTQLEHLPMEGGATISWLEAYGPISVDPAKAHSKDWVEAYQAVDAELEKACPRDNVEALLKRCPEHEVGGPSGS